MKYLNSAYYILFFVLKIAKCKHFFLFFNGSETFVLLSIIGHFFCQKKSKCRDFGQKFDENPLLHSKKILKVKYLNFAYHIVIFFVLKIAKCKHFFLFFYGSETFVLQSIIGHFFLSKKAKM